MRKILLILTLAILLLAAACGPDNSVAPTPVAPTPVATAAEAAIAILVSPTPVATAASAAAITVAPTPVAPDALVATAASAAATSVAPTPVTLFPVATVASTVAPQILSAYNLSVQVITSPDGAWTVEALRGEIRPEHLTDTSRDYNRITAENPTAGLRWVYEEHPNHGLGEGVPAGFTFSAGADRLYFYDRISPDGGCAGPFTAALRSMDLATGKVERVAAFDREAHFSLAPDASRVAEIVGSTVELTVLPGGEKQIIPFEKPTADEIGRPPMHWSADGLWLAFDLHANPLQCEMRPLFLDTVVVDIEKGTARLLGSPENIAGGMAWDAPGRLRVQTGRDVLAVIDARTGASQPAEVDREAFLRQEAELGLRRYLTNLYLGRDDPSLTEQAAAMFSGDWGALSSRYPAMRFISNAAMLGHACAQGDLHCYPVRQIQFVEQAAETLRFNVQYLTPNGEVLTAGDSDWFGFTVKMNGPEQIEMLMLPPVNLQK